VELKNAKKSKNLGASFQGITLDYFFLFDSSIK